MVMVLMMIAIAMGMSYALIYSQITESQLRDNVDRRVEARDAAMIGMEAAYRAMHLDDWAGVDSTLTGVAGDNSTYSVKFTTGDASLSAGDADYNLYPYRVTLTATGKSLNASQSSSFVEYTTQTIVQLVPQQFATAESGWDALSQHTMYQWGDSDIPFELPARIEGPAHLQGNLQLCEQYPYDNKPFHGAIDDVAIFNKALSQTEIQALVASATDGITTSTATLVASHLPLAWWKLNESAGASVAAEVNGLYPGAYVGTTNGVSGLPLSASNTAAYFGGTSDHIDCGSIDVSGSAMTILAWFKADSFDTSDGRIISKATGTGNSDHYWMLSTVNKDGAICLRFRLRTNGSTLNLHGTGGTLSTGNWVLAAAVYDGSQMLLYQNGVLVGATSKSGSIDSNSGVPVFIGDNPPGSSRRGLLAGLEALRTHPTAAEDHRPFTGPVSFASGQTDDETIELVSDVLNVSTSTVSVDNSVPVTSPSTISTYQLYPGGPSYSPTPVSTYLYSVILEPDPATNPLGIFCAYYVELHGNTTIRGTLISKGSGVYSDIVLRGDNVHLEGINLPLLPTNTSSDVQLPVALAADDITVKTSAGVTTHGLVVAWDDFTVEIGEEATMSFEVEGAVGCQDLKLCERNNWDVSSSWWKGEFWNFRDQSDDADGEPYFARWLEDEHSLDPEPTITIKEPATSVSYHWHDWSDPLFVHAANDPNNPDAVGLSWKIIRWADKL